MASRCNLRAATDMRSSPKVRIASPQPETSTASRVVIEPAGSSDLERRELRLEPRHVELEEPLRREQVLELVLTEVLELNSFDAEGLDDPRRRVGEEDLAAVAGRADPSRSMDADTDVALFVDVRLRGVQAHPHAYRSVRKRALGVDRRRDGVARALESDEEAVTGRVDLVAVVPGEGVTQELPVLAAHASEVRAELPREIGRSFDVREQERELVPRGRLMARSSE